ncbi:MAG: CBS domain-containing protein [Kofleriaceae bacterium]
MTALVKDLLAHKGTRVEIIRSDATIDQAIAKMIAAGVGSLIVLDGSAVLGIVTERDMMVRVLAAHRDPLITPVRDVMSRDLIVAHSRDPLTLVSALMTDCRFRHLPVVDDGKLVGLISAGDVTAWQVREQRQTIDDLHDYITR